MVINSTCGYEEIGKCQKNYYLHFHLGPVQNYKFHLNSLHLLVHTQVHFWQHKQTSLRKDFFEEILHLHQMNFNKLSETGVKAMMGISIFL